MYRKSVDHQLHRAVWHLYNVHHWDPDLLDPVDLVKRDLDPIAVHDLGPQDLVSVKFDQRLALYSKPIIHTHQGIGKLHLEYLIIYGHSGQFQERPPPPPPPPRPVVPQTVRSAPNASLSAPLGSAPFNAFSIPSTPSGHVPLNDHEHSLFEILLNQQVKEHPTSEAFLQHVAKLLAQADILSQDLGPMRMATYDPSYYGWNQGSDQPAPWSIFTFCRSQFCMIEPTFQKECHRYQDGRHQTEASMKSSIWPSHMPQNLVILLPFSKKVSWHLANSTLQKVKVSLLRDSK